MQSKKFWDHGFLNTTRINFKFGVIGLRVFRNTTSDNLKTQNFKIIITEKICQKLKLCYFCYIICERHLEENSGRLSCIENVRPSNLRYFE